MLGGSEFSAHFEAEALRTLGQHDLSRDLPETIYETSSSLELSAPATVTWLRANGYP